MKILKATMLTLAVLLGGRIDAILHAQTSAGDKAGVQWLSWEEAMDRFKKEKRKIVVDVYTENCRFCKQMEETTFNQPDIARLLNQYYYPVKFDAEQRKDLEYLGKYYKFVRSGRLGYHELAAEWLKGRLSFPALVFLDENLNVIQSFVGFKSPSEFERIATYFGDDHYKRTPWSTYLHSFKSSIDH
jgi:thioredoxin-related protein